ncbi:MAG: CoB--CoM heterodisulfide reductase iron-sulfur subunit B family protein [Candidatus Aminicenantes bacterium]|nr:CoB--CoM heterodisulfide reductase iron-sulfur subunit B family protein [Candidatus Aminicenantes bacterium]
MKVSYYPGCSLHSTGLEYGESTKDVCQKLDIELAELTDWNCCGAGSAHTADEGLAVELAMRNLAIAEQAGLDLVVPCAACFHRFKVAEKHIQQDKEPVIKTSYTGNVPIKHLLDFLTEETHVNTIKENIKKPLTGLKAVCYYGCLITRPPKITDVVNYENPQTMDELLSLLGAEVRPWSYKTDCCGGSLILARSDIVSTLTGKLIQKAEEAGANCIVTACPLCQANLDNKQSEISKALGKKVHFPTFYFTELLGLALGSEDANVWMNRHLVNPRELLKSQDLL